tara:strand:- start:563 stop:1282 length:720 start_codon:yes stop_codon:yes gene_type:complete
MKLKKNSVLIIIPTYNEQKNINLIINKIKRSMAVNNYNVLFIDDNSNDGTQEILKKIRNKKIFYIVRNKKLGIGSAHKFGIKKGYKFKYRYIITLDCDGTHDPKYINEMINKIRINDMVITNRFTKKNSLKEWSFHRKFITTLRHIFVCNIFGVDLDSSGAFRIYDCKKIKISDILKAKNNGYSFFTESTIILNKIYKIGQIPILLPKRYSGYSKMRLSDIVFGLLDIIFLYLKNRLNN